MRREVEKKRWKKIWKKKEKKKIKFKTKILDVVYVLSQYDVKFNGDFLKIQKR